ncbi:MAG: CmpA/NrtA family ABC transporter substrate-binding protein [Magnetospirillum sp.]|nr:CmpA/NrtA family ABC transporter substrate-binding protein [Magnetospirillum sp.]
MAKARLEKTRLTLGMVPLVDCAPLAIARERGFFAAMGLDVEISRESSWASIRDKVAVGVLDGAHMLAPLPLAMSAGVSPVGVPMMTGLALSLGGTTVTLANAVWDRLAAINPGAARMRPLPATLLRRLVEADREEGREPLTFASVHPVSSHTYDLIAWLDSGGIAVDRDVRLVVVPPPQMVARLSAGDIAGVCVGEPWGALAMRQGLGRVILTSGDVSPGRVEKVFAVTRAWAEAHPETHLAVLEALIGAARWCDDNRAETAEILARPHLLNLPVGAVAAPLLGEDSLPGDLIRFHRPAANVPWRSHALWYLDRMAQYGQLPPETDRLRLAETVFRPDLYRLAATRQGVDVPPDEEEPII